MSKRNSEARATKLPVSSTAKRPKSGNKNAMSNAIAITLRDTELTESPMEHSQSPETQTSFANSATKSLEDWAEDVQQELNKQTSEQEPATAFEWARSLQQQISAQGQQLTAQAQQLAQHHEVLNQLQQLIKENNQLKSDLAQQRDENAMLRKRLDDLQHDTQQQNLPRNTEMAVDDDDETRDAIGTACDKVALALSNVAQHGSSSKDSIHAHVAAPVKNVSYASITKKNSIRTQRRKARVDQPTDGMIAWAARKFISSNNDNDKDSQSPVQQRARYDIVYLKSPQRTSHGEARRALTILKIPQARIIDVHFPIRGVIGLLIHADFKTELLELLKQAKVHPVEFNPIAASTIINPEYADYTGEQRQDKAKELYSNRMLRACARMSKAYLGAAILRHFVDLPADDMHHLDKVVMKQFEMMRPRPTRRQPTALPSVEEARRLLSSESSAGMDTNE